MENGGVTRKFSWKSVWKTMRGWVFIVLLVEAVILFGFFISSPEYRGGVLFLGQVGLLAGIVISLAGPKILRKLRRR